MIGCVFVLCLVFVPSIVQAADPASGTYTSVIHDAGAPAQFGDITWNDTTSATTSIVMEMRAGNVSDLSDGVWTTTTKGYELDTNFDGRRYYQYRITFATDDGDYVPSVDDVSIEWTDQTISGSLVSSPYNTTNANNSLASLAWSATTSTGNDISFQLQTSADGITWSGWLGPNGTSASYFTDNTGGETLPASLTDATSDQYMQYQAFFTTDGIASPTLTSVTLSYSPPDPPSPPTITDSVITTTSIALTWSSATNTDYYTVSTTIPGQESVTTTSLSYTFTSLTPGTSYDFQIQATDIYAQNSGYSTSSAISTALPGTLEAPTITSFTITATTLQANWSVVSGADHYTVSSTAIGTASTTSDTSLEVTDLTPNTSYTWKLNTVDAFSQDGAYSAVTTTYTNPAQPVSVVALANGQTSANLTWGSNSNPDTTVYQIYQDATLKGSTTSTSFTVTGLSSGTSYTFTIRAIYNSDNTSYVSSDTSNSITTTVPAQTVTLTLTPDSGAVAFQFLGSTVSHTAEVTSIVNDGGVYKAALTLHSNTVSVTLAQGESQNVDLSGNGSNDTTITMSSVSASSASFTLTAIPQGGAGISGIVPSVDKTTNTSAKAITINNSDLTTNNPQVKLVFNITNAQQLAIANNPEFTGISFENYQTTKDWTLTGGNGLKTVFVKFRSKDGATIIYSATITLTGQSIDDPNSISILNTNLLNNCPLLPEHAYKVNNNNAVYYITTNCTKRAFTNPKVFFTYFDTWSHVVVTSTSKLKAIINDTLGFMPYGPKYDPQYGALVKVTSDPKVYLLLNNNKYWITNENVFNTLNYQWNWIEDVDQRLLDNYTTKEEITTTSTHPNYTLIKYNNDERVYRLEPNPYNPNQQVKRHILDEQTFQKLNFRFDRVVTIPETEVYLDGSELGL